MNSSNQNATTGGIGPVGLLGVLFVGLKLTGYISWPWVWVLAPFWIPISIVLAVLLACVMIIGVSKAVEESRNARR